MIYNIKLAKTFSANYILHTAIVKRNKNFELKELTKTQKDGEEIHTFLLMNIIGAMPLS